MHLFHLGFLFQRPVTVNVIREGVPAPVPYQKDLFDYGKNKIERPLPVNLGFAGFRLHYPLNTPKIFDELIAFLGASYFRFLSRDRITASRRGASRSSSRASGASRRSSCTSASSDRDADGGCRACCHLRASRRPW